MSATDDPKAKTHLQGQCSEESRAAVQAQRDLKKKKDSLRKLMSKLKLCADDDSRDALKAEISQHEQDIAHLERISGAVPSIATAPEQPTSAEAAQPSPAAPAPVGPPPPPKLTNTALQGQETDEARDAVQAQRDLKKRQVAQRKLASKLKAASADEKELVELQLKENDVEIARLEQIVSRSVTSDAAPTVGAHVPTPPAVAAAPPAAPRSESATVTSASPQGGAATTTTMTNLLKQTMHKPPSLAQLSLSTPVDATAPAFHTSATPSNSSLTTPIATPGRKSNASGGASALVFKPLAVQLSPTLVNPIDGRIVEPPNYAANVHPRVAEAGLHMQNMQLVGGNARTLTLLDAILEIARSTPVLDVPTFTNRERREFERIVNSNFKFLSLCREPCAGMTYVKRTILSRLTNMIASASAMPDRVSSGGLLDSNQPASPTTNMAPSAFHSRSLPASSSRFHLDPISVDTDAGGARECSPLHTLAGGSSDDIHQGAVRDVIIQTIQDVKEEIFRSIHSLVEERAQPHIASGDCILTFGRSSSIELILQHAVSLKRRISVIVVDSAPLYEGKGLAARLQRLGIPVSYGLITSICTLLPRCTKVMIGASAVLQSGEVYSRAGTATVATAAKAFRKPVLCMCESHKFVPKVWIGSLVQNSEVGDLQQRRPMGLQSQNIPVFSDQVTKPWPLREQNPSGYLYDLTPSSSVDMVVCEMGCLSTSAIAAAIRDRQDREVLMLQP